MKKFLFIFLFIPFLVLGSGGLSFAQTTSVIDSLLTVLQSAKEDTDKVKILIKLCNNYRNKNSQKALEYGNQGLALAEKLNFKKGIAFSLNNIGRVYEGQGNYEKSLEYYINSLNISEELKYNKMMANTLYNIGWIYRNMRNYDRAIKYYLKGLEINKRIDNNTEILKSLRNIGWVYYTQENFEKALDYHMQTLQLSEKIVDSIEIAHSLNSVGNVYDKMANYKKAIEFNLKALKIREKMNDKHGIAISFNDIALIYLNQKSYKKALKYFLKSLNINEELNNKHGVVISSMNIGETYSMVGNFKKAIEYGKKSLFTAKGMGKHDMILACKTLTEIYAKQNNYKKAYEYHQLYSNIKDSLFNEESSKQIAEMQEKYESEKREKEIELLNKEKALQATDLNRQKIIIWSVAGGLLLVIALAFFIYRGYRQKQQANVLLAAQKQVIETKNKDITDSIRYAENIQHAILPTDEQIKELLPDSFVLFKPKDIVSGDFYWIAEAHPRPLPKGGERQRAKDLAPAGSVELTEILSSKQRESQRAGKVLPLGEDLGGAVVLFAACDCTGHGVPGAFMSMIGNSLLNEVVNDKGITKPNEILYEVRKGIINSLKQKGESAGQKDGMDAALCAIDFENMKLEYAGAYNPLYLIRKGELQQIKADKQPVSFLTKEEKPFTNHGIDLQEGDTIYIFSDGYQDQFGGPRGKKFMSKRFRQLFIDIQTMNMEEQKEHLDKTIEEWKGDGEQVDDILVIGVRV